MRMLRVAALTAAASIAACGPGGAPGPHTGEGFPAQKPNPVTVVEHLDSSPAASAIIGAAGGTLTVTASDGVKYTLVVPANALPLDELIKMTPVASLDGLTWSGGLLAAVHLEPEGTILVKSAVLTIVGAKSPPSGTTAAAFVYEGTGADFHLYPFHPGATLQLQVWHFSSPGVGAASPQDIAQQQQHPPATDLEELEQDVEAAILSVGQGVSMQSAATQIENLLNSFGTGVLAPEMDLGTRSGVDVASFMQAFADLNAAERLAELQGMQIANYEQLKAKWIDAFPRVFKDQVNACFNDHDVRAGVRALYLRKIGEELGIQLPGELDAVFRCLTFKLDFETQLQSQNPSFKAGSHVMAGKSPVSLLGGGSAPLTYVDFRFETYPSLRPCNGPTTSTKVTEDFRTFGIEGLTLDTEGGHPLSLTDFFVDITPGQATETLTVSCPAPIGSHSSDTTYYNTNWEHLHDDQHFHRTGTVITGVIVPPVDFYAISGWTVQNGSELFAQKTFNKTAHYANVTVTEMTTFKLWHEPEGQGIP